MLEPATYDHVNHVLRNFVESIGLILGSQFLALYLYGSLALGDFDPNTSDIDFLVVTEGEISDASFAALGEMHARFAHSCSPWATRIEVAYIPRQALNHAAPTSARYPQLEKATELFRAPLEIGWVFQRYTLRERGVVVTGPAPRKLIGPVDPAEMRRASAMIVGGWLEQSHNDPAWIAWARQRHNLAFVVLTICRMLYSLKTGSVASKPRSVQWAARNLEPRWTALIKRSLASQHSSEDTPESDLDEMLRFLGYALELVRPDG